MVIVISILRLLLLRTVIAQAVLHLLEHLPVIVLSELILGLMPFLSLALLVTTCPRNALAFVHVVIVAVELPLVQLHSLRKRRLSIDSARQVLDALEVSPANVVRHGVSCV